MEKEKTFLSSVASTKLFMCTLVIVFSAVTEWGNRRNSAAVAHFQSHKHYGLFPASLVFHLDSVFHYWKNSNW